MADRVERDLQWILDQPVNNWRVEDKCIVSTEEGTVLPLLRDRALSDEALQVIADALNFVVKCGALQLLAKRLAALALPVEPPPRSQAQVVGWPTAKTWDDYENNAKATYGGGYRDGHEVDIFHHGMQTIFNLLRAEFPEAHECLALRSGASATPASRSQAKRIALQSAAKHPTLDALADDWEAHPRCQQPCTAPRMYVTELRSQLAATPAPSEDDGPNLDDIENCRENG